MKIKVLFIVCLLLGVTTNVEAKDKYLLKVLFDLHVAFVYDEEGQVIGSYSVTTPRKEKAPNLPQRGSIENIIFDPFWYPTENVKKRYYRIHHVMLPDVVSPGHKLNYMGAFKWILSFKAGDGYYEGDSFVRIHEETNPQTIGQSQSSGCIRFLKKDGIYLSNLFLHAKELEFVFTTTKIENNS